MFDPIASSTTRKPVPRWFYLAPSERAPTGSYGAVAPQSFMICNVASRKGNAARPITRYSIGEGGRLWRGRPCATEQKKVSYAIVVSSELGKERAAFTGDVTMCLIASEAIG